MPSKKLSDTFLQTLKAPPNGRRVEFFDLQTPGLAIRVSTKDDSDGTGAKTVHKSWCVFYRAAGKLRRYTFGTYPEFTLEKARDHARAARQRVREGFDPGEEKRARRDNPPPEADTFAAVAADWLTLIKKEKRASTYVEYSRLINRDVVPRWRNRPAASITRRDVIALLDGVAGRGAEVQANKTLARLKTLFNWAVGKDRLGISPMVGVEKSVKEKSRDRALSDEELTWFWRACDALDWPLGPLLKLLLLTAQRRGEVAGMEWSEINFEKRLWTIPREKAKNDVAHEVQLSDAAIEVLQCIPRLKGSPFLFSTNRKTVMSSFSAAKRRIDALVELERRRALGLPERDEDYRKALKIPKGKPLPVAIPGWTLHDLRRTATTGMANLKIPPHICERILNHTAGTISGVARVYNRAEYVDERRAALQTWGRYVTHLVAPPADDKVADLAKARRSKARRSKGTAAAEASA